MLKRKSLVKSIVLSSVAVLISVVVIVCAVYSTVINIKLFSVIKQNSYHSISAESIHMNSWIAEHETIIEGLALSAVECNMHGEKLKSYMQNTILASSDSIMDCYVAWESEAPVMTAAVFIPPDDYVPQERSWYKRSVSENRTILTDPYIDAFTGKIVVTIAAPIRDNDTVVGCCGLDIDITELVTMTNSLKIDEKGYAILVDASDNVVVNSAYPEYNHQLEGSDEKVVHFTDIDPLYTEILASADTDNIIRANDHDGVKRFFPAVSIGDCGWKLIYAADYSEASSTIVSNTILVIVLGVLGMAAGCIFISIKFGKRLKPLKDIEEIVVEMEHGKLEHVYPVTQNDEIGVICKALENTNSALKTYINEIDRCLSRMSQGDFLFESSTEFVGEFITMGESLKNIRAAISGTFAQINSAAGQIASGSGGVAAGATGLAGAVSRETTIISSVINEVTDIAGDVAKSAENALTAKNETLSNAETIRESSRQMNELLDAMGDISDYASKIVKIIATIDDIAFQTNILALNASVEAARAGAAGKGFAVVADEVRNLAGKSAEASGTTGRIINETVAVVNRGRELANRTAELLNNVVESTKVIEAGVTEISEVTEKQKEQLAGIVNKLGEVSGVVQTTAATAEESAAASEELDSQVEMLRDSLRKYRV
ncbi:MAG: methyl-accepting chemotaxis protein [Huintestinicola sp.]